MQSLEFDLIVYAPHRPVEGFVNDMEVGSVSHYPLILFLRSCKIFLQENLSC